jgi:hypothetical protein
MTIDHDCKEGYSIFVSAVSEAEAIQTILDEHLYEDMSDLNHIDYVGEISQHEYQQFIQ